MKNKNRLKLVLDVAMVLVLLLMYKKNVISLSFHETAGLCAIGIMFVHLILNWKWIAGMTKGMFRKGLPVRTRVLYVLNILLIMCLVLMLISSLLISKILFPSMNGSPKWMTVHFCVAALLLTLGGIHLGLHFTYIKNTIAGAGKKFPQVIAIVLLAAGIVCGVYGIYAMKTSSYGRWLSAPFVSQEAAFSHEGAPSGGPGTASGGQQGTWQGKGLHNGQGPAGGDMKGGPGAGSWQHFQEPVTATGILSVVWTYFSIAMTFAMIIFCADIFVFNRKKQRK